MVSNNEKMKVLAVRDKIRNGQYVVFSGPLYKQDGTLLLEKVNISQIRN
jgi:simple sugar transport system substrate-binding protein